MSTLKIEEVNGSILIHCPSEILESTGKELAQHALVWVKETHAAYVLDLSQTKTLDTSFYRPIMLLQQFTKKRNLSFSSTHVSPELLTQLRKDGMEDFFKPEQQIQKAVATSGSEKNQKFEALLQSFQTHTEKVFSIQCNMAISTLSNEAREITKTDQVYIAGLISLNGKGLSSTVGLCFPLNTFLETYSSMFMEEKPVFNPEMKDAASELLNIIFGQTKIHLNDQFDFGIAKAIPSVILGDNLTLQQQGATQVNVLTFQTKKGKFFLQLSV